MSSATDISANTRRAACYGAHGPPRPGRRSGRTTVDLLVSRRLVPLTSKALELLDEVRAVPAISLLDDLDDRLVAPRQVGTEGFVGFSSLAMRRTLGRDRHESRRSRLVMLKVPEILSAKQH